MFTPTQIIFATTDECNLHCAHCFVHRNKKRLNIDDAITLLHSCKGTTIEKIGFTGGEPFLYLDFLIEITKEAITLDYLFDQIMTNGDWWQTEDDLKSTLQKLYDSGYDGKFGLSYDTFHGQSFERMQTFVNCVNDIFGCECVNVQTVKTTEKKGVKIPSLQGIATQYFLPQTYPSENPLAWNNKKWFKEDFCEGPGNIFYVHADGNIAPCCGFANENKELFIGNIKDDFNTIMQNAQNNRLIHICFEKGLSKLRKQMKKQLPKGKCNDICSFCDFVCKNS